MPSTKRDETLPNCARCPFPNREKVCLAKKGKGPADCPTLRHKQLAKTLFADMPQEERAFAVTALVQENASCDLSHAPTKPRIVEIVEFAKRMKYARLGLIFCGGAAKEAGIVQEILEVNGFTVVSVMCKAGGIRKGEYALPEGGTSIESTACNPVFQAKLVNLSEVDFSILVNLCVGHDSLAIRHLTMPATVLAAKDRVTGHSPLAPLYLMDNYYSFLKKPLPDPQ